MNEFTLIIHNKGWSVKGACEHWGIHYDTYNKRCNSPKMHNQLESMCNGLTNKSVPFGAPLTDNEETQMNKQILTAMDNINIQIKRLEQ